ncbi:hypothetical protein GDO86_007964 [Hymenochirus boettgeri]|uniref:Complement component C8 alpha chain n=1 Tax=Hymenochirus boettgeri TaxID=247094 RepID=A0A8T2J322_9PIPI|nr:hypothetical protein GDO86_007964 [Hymenochirus boettgeri]
MKPCSALNFTLLVLLNVLTLWCPSSAENVKKSSSVRRKIRSSYLQPLDCRLGQWSEWTPCDPCQKKTTRYRKLNQPAKYEGRLCSGSLWDEKACQTSEKCVPVNNCGEDFQCQDTGRCIKKLSVCNGEQDCRDDSDELNCDNEPPLTFCKSLFPIPGIEKAVRGYNILTEEDAQNILDPNFFGGECEYIYNGEWREQRYEPVCEEMYYSDDEKYLRKPYNFHIYQFLARADTGMSLEIYQDSTDLVNAIKRDFSFSFQYTIGISVPESPVGLELGLDFATKRSFLKNISSYSQKDVEFVRMVTKIQTARFRMRRNLLALDEDVLLSLMELPDTYNFGLYSKFISDYGTHLIMSGKMGGIMENILVLDKKIMKQLEIQASMVSNCFGGSIGIVLKSETKELEGSIKASGKLCKMVDKYNEEGPSSSNALQDVITYVKGGDPESSGGILNVFDGSTYRIWGKSLKYNPAVIESEILPIYEVLKLTGLSGIEAKRQNLKRAFDEYLNEFDPCRCGPCHNNGIPILTNNVCTCQCASGFQGPSCETTFRKDNKADGRWSCWSSWSNCQFGKRQRTRECNNPAPKNGGASCLGKSIEQESC